MNKKSLSKLNLSWVVNMSSQIEMDKDARDIVIRKNECVYMLQWGVKDEAWSSFVDWGIN